MRRSSFEENQSDEGYGTTMETNLNFESLLLKEIKS